MNSEKKNIYRFVHRRFVCVYLIFILQTSLKRRILVCSSIRSHRGKLNRRWREEFSGIR